MLSNIIRRACPFAIPEAVIRILLLLSKDASWIRFVGFHTNDAMKLKVIQIVAVANIESRHESMLIGPFLKNDTYLQHVAHLSTATVGPFPFFVFVIGSTS